MQLYAYRNTEAGYRQKAAVIQATPVVLPPISGAQRDLILLQKQEVSEAMRRARAAARRYNGHIKSLEDIARMICVALNVRKIDLISHRRTKRVAFARQAVCYWACRLTAHSLPEIGKFLGGRDHTTVLHGTNVYPDKRAAMGRHLKKVR